MRVPVQTDSGAVTTSVGVKPLDPVIALAAVQRRAAGAAVLFTGVVRDHDHGRGVSDLEYESHPSAGEVIEAIAREVVADHPDVMALEAHHRVGPLAIGEVALVAVVSCAHRRASFEACEDLVERIKTGVPIWKRQVFDDGAEEWVNSSP
jgi:molybdopterin synthase catalytic subunit